MRTRGTTNQAQFDFQLPLTIPQGFTCLVNVEGFFGIAPSLFGSDYVNSSQNYFMYNDTVNLWTTQYTKDVFIRASSEKMTNNQNKASFIFNFLESLDDPLLTITLPRLGFHDDITNDIGITYNSIRAENQKFALSNLDGVTAAGITIDEDRLDFLTWYFSMVGTPEFIISKTGNHTYTLRGPWLMSLGLNPTKTYTISSTSPLYCEMQVNGLQFMNLNCGIGRSVMTTQTSDMRLTPSDIIWTIPLPVDPPEQVFYTNFSSGGKVPCNNSVIETLEIYFTDRYNYQIMDLSDWTVILTFDYMEKEKPVEPVTSKDVRRFIASY